MEIVSGIRTTKHLFFIMIKLGKYISELLFSNDSVIVPGFGSFSTKYVPARFIPEEKIVESPRKIVDFSPEPKQGDSPLIAYMAEKEGKSHDEILHHLAETLGDVEHALEAGKNVDFELIGTFHQETDGSLKFEPSRQINYLENDTGVAVVDTPAPKPLIEKKETEKEQDTLKASALATSTKPKTDYTMKEPEKKSPEQAKPQKEKIEGMDPALKWLAIIGIPLLVILIILFWQFNYFFGDEGLFRSTETVVVEAPVETPVEVIEEIEEVPEPEPVPEPEKPLFDPYLEPPKPDLNRPVYYVVVGSFRSQRNAQNLALQLRKEDHRLASVLDLTPAQFHRVYSGWYYDLDEAKAAKQQLDKNLREIAWILHR